MSKPPRRIQHDDFCAKTRFGCADCTCGAEETAEIIRDVMENFKRDLRRIFRARR